MISYRKLPFVSMSVPPQLFEILYKLVRSTVYISPNGTIKVVICAEGSHFTNPASSHTNPNALHCAREVVKIFILISFTLAKQRLPDQLYI